MNIEPCPYCQEVAHADWVEAGLSASWCIANKQVMCGWCGMHGPILESAEAAIEAWNKLARKSFPINRFIQNNINPCPECGKTRDDLCGENNLPGVMMDTAGMGFAVTCNWCHHYGHYGETPEEALNQWNNEPQQITEDKQ